VEQLFLFLNLEIIRFRVTIFKGIKDERCGVGQRDILTYFLTANSGFAGSMYDSTIFAMQANQLKS
jgi:hypothetical protein